MPKNNSPSTPMEWWKFLRSRGLRASIRILTVGQIYAIASTVFAIGAGFIAVFPNSVPRPDELVHCSDAKGYPLGKWIEAGTTTVYSKDAFPSDATPGLAEYIWFQTPTTGFVQTDEPNSAEATFSLGKNERVAPHQPISITSTDSSSSDRVPYVSVSRLSVSADGCYMTGTWSDNDDKVHEGRVKQKGTATFFWMAPTSFWVRRDPSRDSSGSRY